LSRVGIVTKRPKAKRTPAKRGTEEERPIITDDPQIVLESG
jgi:hypothetical protein